MPLVERALQVLERREVTPQLGLLKSTMLQLDPRFSEKAYGSGNFTDFVEKLRNADYVNISGGEGRYVIERKTAAKPEEPAPKPEQALPLLRDVLETHRLQLDSGCLAEELAGWVSEAQPDFDWKKYGFQEFTEFLNFAQDKLLVRIEPDEEKGLLAYLGAEFYPPALPEPPEPALAEDQQPVLVLESPPAAPKRRRTTRKKTAEAGATPRGTRTATRRTRKRGTAVRRQVPE
jgi:hypothetical protein